MNDWDGLDVVSERGFIETALSATERVLNEQVPTSDTRVLSAKVERFRRSVERWSSVPPTNEQRLALRHLAIDLHDEARGIAREAITQTEGELMVPAPGALPARVTPLVLIVDDDDATREWMRIFLEDEGYEVEEATNGGEALTRLGRAPAPSLILLDLMMPVIDGHAVLESALTHPSLARIPIVVTTASSIDKKSSSVAVPILRKPFSADALLRIVEQYAPRLWDDDEPITEETPFSSDAKRPGLDTTRQRCTVCSFPAETRCSGCGEAYCRNCLDAGPSGECASCWRLGRSSHV